MIRTDEKRRLLLKGIATALCCGIPIRLMAREDAEQTRISKQQAQYQSHPNGEKRCGNCTNFIATDNTCQLVEGNVSPEGYCTLWGAAKGASS